MIYTIVSAILSCVLMCTSVAGFFMSDSDENIIFTTYVPSVHFQINEKDGNFIPISELLKNRNKLLRTVIR